MLLLGWELIGIAQSRTFKSQIISELTQNVGYTSFSTRALYSPTYDAWPLLLSGYVYCGAHSVFSEYISF